MKAFEKNLTRARRFVEVFDAGDLHPEPTKRRGKGQPSKHENELLRASVIMGIGTLDAYLSDVAAEVLVAQLESATSNPGESARNVLHRVTKEIDTLPLELALVTDPRQRSRIARERIADYLSNRVSNHGPKGVVTTLERMGCAVDWSAIVVPQDLVTKTAKDPPAALEEWTGKRHQLVHQGREIQVVRKKAGGLLDLVDAIAHMVDAAALAVYSG